MKQSAWLFLAGFLLLFPASRTEAQENDRHYRYDRIETEIRVNPDATLDVEERQTFNYVGSYHQGWRSIPLRKIDAISDIHVIDGETGFPLAYVRSPLERTDPQSWGKYTAYKENGAQNIVWYYDLKDARHTWIIRYKVFGGIGFFEEYDELYWNLFTDYDVPVLESVTRVSVSGISRKAEGMFINCYSSAVPGGDYRIAEDGTFNYRSEGIPPKGQLTILAQWPKGLVDEGAYWRQFFLIYWGVMSLLGMIVLGSVGGFAYWYFSEKFRIGRGLVIAQYAPPQKLRPAMAEVICKERVTKSTWPATIVDLAVRGYVRIEERKGSRSEERLAKAGRYLIFGIFILASLGIGIALFKSIGRAPFSNYVIVPLILVYFFVRLKGGIPVKKDYIIMKAREFQDDRDLESYERDFLANLFGGREKFSTHALRSNPAQGQRLYKKMRELEKEFVKHVEDKTKAYEQKISAESKRNGIIIAALVGAVIVLAHSAGRLGTQAVLFWAGAIALALEAWYFRKEARLNKQGEILKEEWLGFKLYLETAEKYRLQNLTPDLFQKYLPYAIIFGVEKKWARAFEALNLPAPEWYGGSGSGAHSGAMTGSSSFSPTSFASSFSASFSSAFASTGASGGAGGAGGGGGSAGGGGGGGGGGAS